MTAFVLLVAIIVGAVLTAIWVTARAENAERIHIYALAQQAADHGEPSREQIEAEWDDLALGRVLAAIDDELDPLRLPLSQSPAARRIRDQINANHDRVVREFRERLDEWPGGAA